MRIGMMADLYKPHVSGVTNYIALNKKFIEEAGHEVFVFTFGNRDYQDEEKNIIRSPGLSLGMDYYFSLNYNREARRLLQSMDVAHVNHPFVSGTLAMRYCRPKGIPIVFTNHTRYDLYAKTYVPVLGEIIGGIATEGFLPVFCRSCDLVISPSEGMRQVLRRYGVDGPVDVVPNGVDIRRFRRPIEPIQRSELGIDEKDVVFFYVGRLGPEKNLNFLLQAFTAVAQADTRVRLVLIGEGPERDALQTHVSQSQIDQQVRFTGLLPYEQLPRYLAMADAFVTASVTEVHPLTVIEAMASGLPVLGIQSPGVGDTIQDFRTGYLTPSEDLLAFTARMMRMALDREGRRTMGRAARQAAEEYAIERTTQMMLERYQQVIDQAESRKKKRRLFTGKPV